MFSLTLFSSTSCDLCDNAESLINEILAEPNLAQLDLQVNKQDIRQSNELVKSYAKRIPVVALYEDNKLLDEINWPFDRQQFVMWMVRTIKANM